MMSVLVTCPVCGEEWDTDTTLINDSALPEGIVKYFLRFHQNEDWPMPCERVEFVGY